MPPIDFTIPMTFTNALEQFSLAYHSVMVALRDEAKFGERCDDAILNAAHLLCSMLEDGYAEALILTDQIERRVGCTN